MAILIGTASWTDKSLIDSGLFYPASVKTPADRLRFYASRFPLVEVDSSYYALPSARNAALWLERTPPDFIFNVKSFRLFTHHQTPPSALPADIRIALGPPPSSNFYYRDLPEELLGELWQRFRTAVQPLQAAGKLGVILLQFPPWFVYRQSHLEHISRCAERLAGYRLAIEFRHCSWFERERRAEVLQFERDHRLVHVVADEPQGFSTSIPAVWEATSPEVAVVRLHGRNRDTWNQKGLASSADRFNYLYSLDELREFTGPIQQLAGNTQQTHIIFNNNFGNYAQRNAGELQQLLL
ncbi:MAG: DUF72 domain-containing protein [Candidatus Competibacteraceae bacterium]